jgi:hypothetical protein
MNSLAATGPMLINITNRSPLRIKTNLSWRKKMLHIQFKWNHSTPNETSISPILPTGYRAEANGAGGFSIFSSENNERVGNIEVVDGMATVKFLDDTAEAKSFVSAWGMKHPSHNPATTLFGYVYEIPGSGGFFQLDREPRVLKQTALDEITMPTPQATSFPSCGEFEPEYLSVATMQKVLLGGKLAEDTDRLCISTSSKRQTMK